MMNDPNKEGIKKFVNSKMIGLPTNEILITYFGKAKTKTKGLIRTILIRPCHYFAKVVPSYTLMFSNILHFLESKNSVAPN